MNKVYSICGMCTVRCPIEVDVDQDRVVWIQGNRRAGMDGSLCPRGGAGTALLYDVERPQQPLIRAGARGEGKWRPATWDEALDYVAAKLGEVKAKYGARSILFSDRGGPFVDLHQAFVRALGSPNYCNHDVSCARNTNHAAVSCFGFGRKELVYDLKNARHVVTQTRNIFEAINVSECKNLTAGLAAGGKLTVIDVRATVTAAKADNFFLIRPGTDYAFNLAVIHVLIKKGLYDADFVRRHFKDFEALAAFAEPCSPEWAEAETGVAAGRIEAFAQELAEAAPAVIWHPGWNTARYQDSFYVARTAYLINALLGAIGAKGGLPLANKPGDVGRKDLKKLADLFPKPEEKRADGAGWKLKHIEAGPGLLDKAFQAIESGEPYPIRAYLAYRHDPLMALPDPERLKAIFAQLDLLVAITFSWSDTAWHADVVLPLSTYLERESILAAKGGLKPQFIVRQRAVPPRYQTKAEWEIMGGIAKRLGAPKLAFDRIEDLWNYQLDGTGVKIEDFNNSGTVSLAAEPLYKKREELKFKTASGQIEVLAPKWEAMGLPSLKPYLSPERPPEGMFRLTFGRVAVHTQGHTVNNPLLNEAMPENVLWIHAQAAKGLGISDGQMVEVANGAGVGRLKAKVTEAIHPEAVFMVHGFGHKLPCESRARGKGAADQELMPGGLEKWDPAGGALALQEHFVTVRKVGK